MQYLLLIYEAEEIWESKTEAERREVLAEHKRLHEQLVEDNVSTQSAPLMPTSTAVSVQVRAGKRLVRDGPFAETKEQLAGFYLINVDTLGQAIEYAAMLPNAATGTLEIRPVADHSEYA